ncbi:MAG TPA: glycosyltransferase family 1 protein [Firmicutes bacterium]|nr:glycosyltransferase family 1 protein [Bacillota bacterium]
MIIGIDGRIIYRRGVGRYIANLIKHLLEADKKNRYIVYLDKNSALNEIIRAKNVKFKRLFTSNAFYYEQFFLPFAAARDKVDILHGTDNTLPCLFPLKCRKTVTIHDVMHIRPLKKVIAKPTFKQRLTDIYNKIFIPMSAKKADAVITVSDYSKSDIVKYIGISEEKVFSIKEGIDSKYKPAASENKINKVKEKYGITKKYIFMSAASDTRKNTIRALEAFNIFNNLTEYDYQLVITSIGGKEMGTTNVMEKIKELNLEKYIVITEYVPDDDMILLYNGAFMFLFPSIWEGFGLQILEAFACGTPVVTSDNTSLKEIAGNAAEFIDPFSVEDIVRGMMDIHKSSAKRKSFVKKGFTRAGRFSWKTTARETLEVYEKIAGKKE